MQKLGRENMQKYAFLYARYAHDYILQILHLYALPTLLMKRKGKTEFSFTDGSRWLSVTFGTGKVDGSRSQCGLSRAL